MVGSTAESGQPAASRKGLPAMKWKLLGNVKVVAAVTAVFTVLAAPHKW